MDLDMDIVRLFLQACVMGGGGVLVSYLLGKWKWYNGLGSEAKLWLSYVFTGVLGIVAYFGLIGMQYVEPPVGYVKWIESLVAVGMTSSGAGQIFYKVMKIRRERG